MPVTKTINFLPTIFQSEYNRKFLNATLDQLVTEPNLQPINGYVGRKLAPGFNGISTYISEPSELRADYQLEPSIVIKNSATDEIDFLTTYPEILQKIQYYGATVENQDKLWSSEYYTYCPRINEDAFINFGQYYWLPNGPDPVPVFSGSAQTERNFYVFPDESLDVYNFSGYNKTPNPDIVLVRGGNYQFEVNQPGKKFWIQSDSGTSGVNLTNGLTSRQVLGVENNGADVGTIIFNVPQTTAQDFFISMTVVQNVDLVSSLSYASIQGQLLSTIKNLYNGIDGQSTNLNGKYIIFGTYSVDSEDWTYNSVTVPISQRYGIWQINLEPSGSDFVIDLVYQRSIPVNQKVFILSGVQYGNTEWYTNSESILSQIAVITAPLSVLYYQDSENPGQAGVIRLVEPSSNYIDVDSEILGKQNYVSPNGVIFTNGLKIVFDTSTLQPQYRNKEYYVEGVGKKITLIAVDDLVISSTAQKNPYRPQDTFVLCANATLNISQDEIKVTTNNFPNGVNIAVGTFPNSINSNYVVEQNLTFKFPYRVGKNLPGANDSIQFSSNAIGITLPGIIINGVSNKAIVPGSNDTTWHYDINQVLINGQDQYGGVVLNEGRYAYTNGNFIPSNAWGNVSGFTTGYVQTNGHSKLIGFAFDGYPIYGPFGYSNPADSASSITRMSSSYVANANKPYRPSSTTVTSTANIVAANLITVSSTIGLNPGMRLTQINSVNTSNVYIVNNALKTAQGLPQFAGDFTVQLNTNVSLAVGDTLTFDFLPGAFIEDYDYVQNSGTLDQFNGRFCVTPEFPSGTYAYFITTDSSNRPTYPYIIGPNFYGSLTVDTNSSLSNPDYLMISRASRDLNPWTRRNRWFHKSVIEDTVLYTGTAQNVDESLRAKRPIIEFDPNIQLVNFGKTSKNPIDIFDTQFTNPFSSVQGSQGIYVDGINLVENMRIVFGSDTDPTTKGKIYIVKFVTVNPSLPDIIDLVLADDGIVNAYDTVSVFNGVENNGKTFWYNGNNWQEGQQKTSLNQPPLFDVFDPDGISFTDLNKYPVVNQDSAFVGTKIFSYKTGSGAPDPILGFPLSYKNFNNIGDILFSNDFDNQVFSYGSNGTLELKKINTGFLHFNEPDESVTISNVWIKVSSPTRQMQNLSFVYDGIDNQFNLDITPDLAKTRPNLIVYVDSKKVKDTRYQTFPLPQNGLMLVIDAEQLSIGSRVDVLVYSSSVSQLGFYQIPDNLNYNAQNQIVDSPTLGEIRNHFGQLSQTSLLFQGSYPGVSNLRDINVENNPGTILQQSAPVVYAGLFLNDESLSFVDSLLYAQQEYTKFKNKFLTLAASSADINIDDPVSSVDIILEKINQIKDKTFPWYYSGMVPYGSNKNVISYNIFDTLQRTYEITSVFSNNEVSNKAILVYLNANQLVYQRDYTFSTTGPGLIISPAITLAVDDVLEIVEYNNTDGNWIPETPSKLGLYPKFIPSIFVDNTYSSPVTFIKGHDGSCTPSFGDFRDQFLLELEKRIFNNIKTEYSEKLVNIYDSVPGKFRDTGYTISQFNNLLGKMYLSWVSSYSLDYVSNTSYQNDNAFTYNYYSAYDSNNQPLQGSWRACYQYFYDCQTPHLTPWEMLGFADRPDWWVSTYGPAPYTSGNKILWDDLESGRIAAGPRQGYDDRFARPGLSKIIPVNENGVLLPPLGVITSKFDANTFNDTWIAGQMSPVETAWRNSSEYPFAMQYFMAMINPGKYFAYGLNTNRYRYNSDLEQYVIVNTNNRLKQTDIYINGYQQEDNTIQRTTGYLNWIVDYRTGRGIVNKSEIRRYLDTFRINLVYRMAGFSGKEYLKILAEQNSPNSTNETIIIPDASYDLLLSKSVPLANPRYSAVIIEKVGNGYKINGYDSTQPYFTVVPPVPSGQYDDLTVIKKSVKYYKEFLRFRTNVPYGTVLTSLQQVANFLSGYERYLSAVGFRFNDFDEQLAQIRNWQLSTKEFLFWTQQGWSQNAVIVLSPCANSIKFNRRQSVVDVVNDSFIGSKVVNQSKQTITANDYSVLRDNNLFQLTLKNNLDLIGFLELNAVQYEHVLVFNNKTQFNDIIYDPILGQRQFRLKLVGNKTGEWAGTLSAPGFIYSSGNVESWQINKDYLKGDLVEYKGFYYTALENLAGTTEFKFSNWKPVSINSIKSGLLQNFARNAQIGQTFYDVDKVNLEQDFDKHALALIGYRNRNYLDEIGLDDVSQVKFYQGFIKEKGTKNAINALATVKIGDSDSSQVKVSEDWAFRVGTYGSTDTNRFVEIVLDESYTLSNPTSIEVLPNNSVSFSSFYIDTDGIYKTSVTPWSSPFLLNRTSDSDYSDDIKTAGFVNIEDVDYTVFNLNDTSSLTANVNSIGSGTIIWAAIDYNQTWNVYRVNDTMTSIVSITNALDQKVTIQTDKSHGLLENDTVLLQNVDRFNGFYKVISVSGLTSFIVRFVGSLAGFSSVSVTGTLLKLVSMKLNYATDIDSVTPLSGWDNNDKVWVSDYNNEEWAVINKTSPWDANISLPKGFLDPESRFGTAVKLGYNKSFAVAGMPGYNGNVGAITNYVIGYQNRFIEDITSSSNANDTIGMGSSVEASENYVFAGAPLSNYGKGYVFVFKRGVFGSITETQILAPNTASNVGYGYSLAVSQDDKWLYVGAPTGNKVYIYGLDETVSESNSVVSTNGVATSYSLSFTPVCEETLLVKLGSTTFVPFKDYTLSGNVINFTSVPDAGTLTVYQSPGYRPVQELTGNANSSFGFSLATSLNGEQLVVGSPTANITVGNASYINSGKISIYDRSINSFIATESQVYFGGLTPLNQYTVVTVDNQVKTLGIDYSLFASTYIVFFDPPGTGKIVTIDTNVFNLIEEQTPNQPINNEQFGYSVEICNSSCQIFVGAPYQSSKNTFSGAVYRFDNESKLFGSIVGTVQYPTVVPGSSIRLNNFQVSLNNTSLVDVIAAINQANIPGITASNQNNYLKLESSSLTVKQKLQILPGTTGSSLASLGLETYKQTQIILDNTGKAYNYFGKLVKVNEDNTILLIASDSAPTSVNTTFDPISDATIFDTNSVDFKDEIKNSGAAWIYGFVTDARNSISYPGEYLFIQQLTSNSTNSIVSDDRFGSAIDMVDDEIIVGSSTNKTLGFNTGKVFKFINASQLIGWDIYRQQDQKVDINCLLKVYVYDNVTNVIEKTFDFIDPAKGKILGLAEQELTFKIDYDPAVYNNAIIDTVTKNNSLYWNDQQVGQVWWDLSTVRYLDYEQGTIKYRTANWGSTFPGSSIDVYEWVESNYPPSLYQVNGGSGTPKYPNNEAYVTLTYIDPISNFTTVKYYFWVRNKNTVTLNQFGRSIPTTTIANYIRDPKSSGISYYAAIRDDSVAIYNLVDQTSGRSTIFHLDYASLINSNVIHNEFVLISENNSKSADIPPIIFNKMIDSLSGIDRFGNPVPDPTLPVQTRYGIDIRPRQSMVIDKNNALKSLIIYVNSLLQENLVSQEKNVDVLNQGEPVPAPNTGEYDIEVSNLEELGYLNLVILPLGYKVLVKNDSSVQNLWTIYVKDSVAATWQPNTTYKKNSYVNYNSVSYVVDTTFTSGTTFTTANLSLYAADNVWNLLRVQSYNLQEYWQYIDWVDPSYDITELPTYTINTPADLSNLDLSSSDTIKILNDGRGKWFIIQVFPNVVKTLAIQDGTIAFKDNLYNLEKYGIGFGQDNFDTIRFDQNPGIETRKIIEALRDDILTGNLSNEFIAVFFNFINYVFGEQKYIDWAFKTSFIDVLQQIKGFTQPAIYNKENQEFYRQYIEEVKPYRTTIKDYILNYTGNDNYQGYATDFDVPPYYDAVLNLNRSPSGEFIEDAKALQEPQYRDWLLNYPYSIQSIEIIDGGIGYISPPTVTITGSSIGNDAVARALITNGIVSKIELLYVGSNYINTPQISITGGNGTGAKALARVSNQLIRNIKTTLVYDRYTYGSNIQQWLPNTSYQQGAILEHRGQAYIVNANFVSGATFDLSYLTLYPVTNFSNANDRVKAFYQPEIGSPGKIFSLLEQGIDYPGVKVQGPNFSDSAGFDAVGFDIGLFDPLTIDEDGTYVISDTLLDAKITSSFTDTNLGIRPEDIIVDGGPYVYDYYRDWTANTYYDKGDLIAYNNRVFYTIQPFTSSSTFSNTYLTSYNIGPYASHAPEELLPGRVFDTLDMTITTLAVDPTSESYQSWSANSGIIVSQVVISDPGEGYISSDIGVLLEGGGYSNLAISQAIVGANGSIIGFTMVTNGSGYQTTPNVIFSGPNTRPATAGVKMSLSNAPSSSDPYPRMIYRIFKDMTDTYTYYRLDGSAQTTLAQNLSITDTNIVVSNSSVLIAPSPAGAKPGVIQINGERIEFYEKDDTTNTLSRIRRGTQGTGAANVTLVGNLIIDSSQNQIIIDSTNRIWYAGNTATGTINVAFNTYELVGTGTQFLSQLTIGGNVFAKDGRYIGKISNIGSNISANVVDTIGFSANVLTFEYAANVTLTTTAGNSYTFYSNTGYTRSNLWYSLGNATATNGQGLFNSNTIQVNFLKQGLDQ